MKISAKTRYGLAAMINIAQKYTSNEYITIISIAEELGISKIYLEQVFSLLKRGKIVISTKGSQGGYKLSRSPYEITVLDIFKSTEQMLFEKTDTTFNTNYEYIEKAMQNIVFEEIDKSMEIVLQKTTLQDLVNEAEKNKDNNNFMFYI
ncbi:MAG: Rrf2 family transcriptional regulator [Clostridiaceae bacterium]